MRFDNNQALQPKESESKAIAASSQKVLENFQNQINILGAQLTQLQATISGMGNTFSTEKLNASESVASPKGSFDELSANTLSVGEVNASRIVTDSEAVDDLHALQGRVENLEADNASLGNATASSLDVDDLEVDNLSISEAAIGELNSTTVNSRDVSAESVSSDSVEAGALNVTGETTVKDVSGDDFSVKNVTASDTVAAKALSALDAEIQNITAKDTKALTVLFDKNESDFIAITEDSYIKIDGKAGKKAILLLEDSEGVQLMSAAIVINEIVSGKLNAGVRITHKDAVSDVFVDEDGNLWIKLLQGVTGKLYYFLTGLDGTPPSTHDQENDPFDISNATDFPVETKNSFTIILDSDATLVKTHEMVIDGNLEVTGFARLGDIVAERAMKLGRSDLVTADEDGNFTAYSVHSDSTLDVVGDTTIGGDVTVGETLSVTEDATVGGNCDITGNETVNGTLGVTGKATLEDDLDVTKDTSIGGDLSVTGDETIGGTLDVTGKATLSDDLEVTKDVSVGGDLEVTGKITGGDGLEITGDASVSGDMTLPGVADSPVETTFAGILGLDNDGKVKKVSVSTSLSVPFFDFNVGTESELVEALTSTGDKRILLLKNITISADITLGSGVKKIYGWTGDCRNSSSIYDNPFIRGNYTITGTSDLWLYNCGTGFVKLDVPNVHVFGGYINMGSFKSLYAYDSYISPNSSQRSSSYPQTVKEIKNGGIYIVLDWENAVTVTKAEGTEIYISISAISGTSFSNACCNMTSWKNCNITVNIKQKGQITNYSKTQLVEMIADGDTNMELTNCNVKVSLGDSSGGYSLPYGVFRLNGNKGQMKVCSNSFYVTNYSGGLFYSGFRVRLFVFEPNHSYIFENNNILIAAQDGKDFGQLVAVFGCPLDGLAVPDLPYYWVNGIKNNLIKFTASGYGATKALLAVSDTCLFIGVTGNTIDKVTNAAVLDKFFSTPGANRILDDGQPMMDLSYNNAAPDTAYKISMLPDGGFNMLY